ncbi:hypothetical protein H5410_003290 [Solanum commersonii]|uniref:Uncharacterized protein n=1 Tax=Solanum commersonii TaxID=4109 RepID=A0A9J6B4A0_SOLCO|nr:hypothetical protein H5410_003290 [Solanum commersonii]
MFSAIGPLVSLSPFSSCLQHLRILDHWAVWYFLAELIGDAPNAPFHFQLDLFLSGHNTLEQKVISRPIDDSLTGLGDLQAFISSFFSAALFLLAK